MWGLLALWAGISVVAASFFGLWSLLRNEGKAVDDHECGVGEGLGTKWWVE